MKKIILIISSLIFLSSIQAQEETKVFERRGSGVFFELLGPGVSYSINYETRFFKRNKSLGGRIGASFFKDNSNPSCFAIPVIINYMIGKDEGTKFLELGLGVSFLWIDGPSAISIDDEEIYFTENVYGTFSIMYHKHPPYGGKFWKIGLTPFFGTFDDEFKVIPSLAIAVGYAF